MCIVTSRYLSWYDLRCCKGLKLQHSSTGIYSHISYSRTTKCRTGLLGNPFEKKDLKKCVVKVTYGNNHMNFQSKGLKLRFHFGVMRMTNDEWRMRMRQNMKNIELVLECFHMSECKCELRMWQKWIGESNDRCECECFIGREIPSYTKLPQK